MSKSNLRKQAQLLKSSKYRLLTCCSGFLEGLVTARHRPFRAENYMYPYKRLSSYSLQQLKCFSNLLIDYEEL